MTELSDALLTECSEAHGSQYIRDRNGINYHVARHEISPGRYGYRASDAQGREVAQIDLGRGNTRPMWTFVDPKYRRLGLMTAFMKYVETDIGHSLEPNDAQSGDARGFWANYLSQA